MSEPNHITVKQAAFRLQSTETEKANTKLSDFDNQEPDVPNRLVAWKTFTCQLLSKFGSCTCIDVKRITLVHLLTNKATSTVNH